MALNITGTVISLIHRLSGKAFCANQTKKGAMEPAKKKKKKTFDGGVVSEISENTARSDQTPYDRCVVEYVVTGTTPWAACWKQLSVTYVWDSIDEPPGCSQMHQCGYDGANNLRHEHCSRRNLHVMTEFKVLQKGNALFHAYVAIYFEQNVSHRISWI